jgi:hypothetical protein
MDRPLELVVRTTSPPEPGLLRPAIAARLAGKPWVAGPEQDVAAAVAEAVSAHRLSAGATAGSPPAATPGSAQAGGAR